MSILRMGIGHKPEKVNSDYVKMCVAEYYRYKRQAPLISFERTIYSYGSHVPDILVVDKKRRLIEVEVKVTLADFRADAKKRIWEKRASGRAAMPYQFYYAVPHYLVDDVKPILRDDCGLLGVNPAPRSYARFSDVVSCIKTAPVNKNSRKVTLVRATKMAYNQTGTLCSLLEKNYKLEQELKAKEAKIEGMLPFVPRIG